MFIIDVDFDGSDNEDSYNGEDLDLYDINHPDYMPPHVQAHLIGPHVTCEVHNFQTFCNPHPGTPE
jgi:hypothetical protein